MRLLLDTHVFLWLCGEVDRIDVATLEALSDLHNELLLSAACVWELAIKTSLGKLALPDRLEHWLPQALSDTGTRTLAVTAADALRVRTLPWHHRDPFDRLLVAQALAGATLVTHDRRLGDYDVPILWA